MGSIWYSFFLNNRVTGGLTMVQRLMPQLRNLMFFLCSSSLRFGVATTRQCATYVFASGFLELKRVGRYLQQLAGVYASAALGLEE